LNQIVKLNKVKFSILLNLFDLCLNKAPETNVHE